jgi:hypothetical protein
MAEKYDDEEIVRRLNGEGLTSSTGKPYTVSIVRWIRFKHRVFGLSLPTGTLTVSQVCERYGVSLWIVHYWIERGVVSAVSPLNKSSKFYTSLDAQRWRPPPRVRSSAALRRSSAFRVCWQPGDCWGRPPHSGVLSSQHRRRSARSFGAIAQKSLCRFQVGHRFERKCDCQWRNGGQQTRRNGVIQWLCRRRHAVAVMPILPCSSCGNTRCRQRHEPAAR